MRRKNISKVCAVASLIVGLLSFSDCSHESDSIEPVKTDSVQQTMLMFFPYVPDLYDYFQINIEELEQGIITSGSMNNTNVFVYICQKNDASKACIYQIKYNKGKCEHDTLQTYTSPDYTSVSGLRSIFNYVHSISKSNIYSVIAGCHGNGWLPKGTSPQYRSFGGSTKDKQIDIADFADAITSSDIKKLDYLMFDDCYMANIETAYELRKATNYIVASTSEVMSAGNPYSTEWNGLSGSPDLAEVCQAFYKFYSTYSYPYGTLSMIDCAATDSMANLMNQINRSYTIDEKYRDSIQVLDGFRTPVYFDLQDYVNHMHLSTDLQERFNKALANLVTYTVCTPYIYSQFKIGNLIEVNHSCGITISDISENSAVTQYIQSTSWWTATHNEQ